MTAVEITGVTIEEDPERLKIILPLKRQWVYLVIYTTLLLVWLGMLAYGLFFTVQIAFSGESFALVFTGLLLLFLFILYRLGKVIWRQWQFYVANRELLFLFSEHLIVRRPVSLLGITTGYDRQYIRPFYFDEEKKCPAFEYGKIYILFGQGLARSSAASLISLLNEHYFPDYVAEDY